MNVRYRRAARVVTNASVAVLAAMLAGCGNGQEAQFVGTLERDRLELTAQSSDPLLELLVREGEAVQAGQVLAKQDTSTLGAARAAAAARAAEARARLAEAERGPRSETIAQARARLASARAALTAEENEYARVERMATENLVAESAVERQREARDRARAAVTEATSALLELTRGTRPEQVEQARAAVAAAEAEVEKLATDLARLTLVAPRSATVEALPYRVGERPPAGSPVVVLLADDAPFARVYVPEPERAALVPGTLADVHVDGIERVHRGRLRYVAAQAAFTPYYALNQRDRSRLAFLAEFTLEEPEARQLPSGIPVQVVPRAPTPR